MMKYDEIVLHEEARRLYANASGIIILSWILGAVVGLAVFGYVSEKYNPVNGIFSGVPIMLIIVALGTSKANSYKIQAQNMLVLCQIEKNTRPPAAREKGAATATPETPG